MRVRKEQVHNGEAKNHNGEIENTNLRCACSAPIRITSQPQIRNVSRKNEQRDDVLRIVVPDVAGEPIDPDKTQHGADGDGNETDKDAALAHAIEKIERWKTPNNVADPMLVQEALLAEVDDTKHAGQAEGSVGQDAKRYVKREDDAGGGWCGEAIWRRQLRDNEEGQDKGKYEGAYGTLPVEKFEAEVSEREQPAEERHGAGEIVVRDSVQSASPFQQRKIMDYQTASQEYRAEAARPIQAGDKVANISGETADVRRKCKQEKEMVHWQGRLRGL
jgi:hypothetical protein